MRFSDGALSFPGWCGWLGVWSRLEALAAGQPDIFAFETLPSLREATLAVDALEAHCNPEATCWVSFISWDGVHTSGGDVFADAVEKIAERDSVVAVGINCP